MIIIIQSCSCGKIFNSTQPQYSLLVTSSLETLIIYLICLV